MDEDAVQDLADETRPQNGEPPPLDLAAAFEATEPAVGVQPGPATGAGEALPSAPASATAGTTPAPEPFQCTTAFIAYMDENGHWIADETIFGRPLVMKRSANWNDYRHAVADIEADMLANDAAGRAAQFTIQLQQQAMLQAVQQRQAQEIKQGLNLPGGGADLAMLKRMAAQGGKGGIPGIPG